MGVSTSELLTAQFYEWEQRGRGWLMFNEPVQLEPPFYPFFFHGVPQLQHVDDSKRPTWASSFIDLFKEKPTPPIQESYDQEPIEPYSFECADALKAFSVFLPKGQKVGIQETEQLLLMLSYCKYPVSFEILGSKEKITIQIVARESDAYHVASQLKAFFPESIVKEREDFLKEAIPESRYPCIIDFGLRDEFMRPVAMAENFNLDPFIGLFGTLEHLQDEEYIVFQILFQGALNPWAESIMRSVSDNEGKAFFMDAPDMLPLAKEKVAYPLFGVTMRAMGIAPDLEKSIALLESAQKAFGRIYMAPSNTLIPLIEDPYDFRTKVTDVILRQSRRLGMLINSRELATIVHLPSESVTTSKLERDTRKTKAVPEIAKGHQLLLGINEHQGKVNTVSVSTSQRLKHTHVIGATGTGKSTFLQNLIVQDINNGTGICVLDPHGDLIESIISYIPENRINDVVIIDPADSDHPVGFNFLTAHSEIEKDILSSDLVGVFRRLSTSWGDQMNSVFANAILAFLESKEGGTLADLRRFLIEKDFRTSFLKTITDPNVIYYWEKEFPIVKSNSIGPILTRLDTFLRPKLIRNMVSQRKSLDFGALLDTKKIVLVKLSQGLIGAENSYLLGTVIVSKIHQAAMARQIQAKEARSDFFLYIDEFQNFITASMESILSGARKYHLGLILAHQDMQQLIKQDSEIASSVMSNAGTRVCFRIGDQDSKRFADGFSYFETEDLQNLNIGEAIVRIDRPEYDFSLTIEPLSKSTQTEEVKNKIIAHSREIYGTPKDLIQSPIVESRVQVEEPIKERVETPITRIVTKEIPPIPTATVAETTEQLVKQKEITQHRYLQSLIKRMAEGRGYKANIEEPTPDGKGRVDVSLEKNGKKIAIEVCMTTDTEWEVHNIQKCFEAGYELVVECSTDTKTLDRIRKKVADSFDESQRSKILISEPEVFFSYLDQEAAKEASTENRIKGYRVKVQYNPASSGMMDKKRENVGKVILDATKKKTRK